MTHETERFLTIAAEILGVASAGFLLIAAGREGRLRVLFNALRKPSPEASAHPSVHRFESKLREHLRESIPGLTNIDFVFIVLGLALAGLCSAVKLVIAYLE
jgi:hypothetical protein